MIDEERDESEQEETAPEEAVAPDEGSEETEAAATPEEEPASEPEEPQGAPAEEEPAAEEEQPTEGEPAAEEQPAAEEPADADEQPAPVQDQPAAEQEPAAEGEPAERPKPKRDRKKDKGSEEPELIPGAHLEPDLVLEEAAAGQEAGDEYAGAPADEGSAEPSEGDGAVTPAPVMTVLDLAADARYGATGKRKRAVARVILKPGKGEYTVNGRALDEFFPRPTLQRTARGPLETVGQQERMDVVAKIHGGGVSSQAGALRHGIARALVEADPNLRGELKRRGFLTRDPRVKERKKAGLKKARKRPQFSKR